MYFLQKKILRSIKLFFKIIFILLLTFPTMSKEVGVKYNVKTKGITIGELYWSLKIEKGEYKSEISLMNKGFLGSLYKFKGLYESSGILNNNKYISKKYNQEWLTKNKSTNVSIVFNELQVPDLKLLPKESELARINFKMLNDHNDPITSFLNIILKGTSSKTIDGRRVYTLFPEKKEGFTKVTIENYINIWADHKRNDLSYIKIYQDQNKKLPIKIVFFFKGSLFTLSQK